MGGQSDGRPARPEDIDYGRIFEEPSALEQVFAIFANVIELDDDGRVLNAKWAERRAALYIRQYVTGEPAQPDFEDWETELHEPPEREDVRPWPVGVSE